MNVDEKLKEICNLREQGEHDEAIELAKYVIEIDERNANAWWYLALSQDAEGHLQESIASLKTVLRLSPKFATGWGRYGVALAATGQAEQGLKALSKALELDPSLVFAIRKAAEICNKLKDEEGEIRYLTQLDSTSMGLLSAHELNRIGIACWNKKHYGRAIDYYHRSALSYESYHMWVSHHNNMTSGSAAYAPYFNLALLYNHNEVSQDVDAIDCLNRALSISHDYKKASDKLSEIKPRLKKLACDVLKDDDTILGEEEWYQFYINPFELLGADRDEDINVYDTKLIQRLKKRLLQEIDLENGKIEHVNGLTIDKSQAIGICEELNDESLKKHHWSVFSEPFLLGFLTRGEIRHFLCLDEYNPINILQDLDEKRSKFSDGPGFREWLSMPFARQYDLVLTRAIRKKRVPMVESLFDGRRWILREHEEKCFEGAKRHVEQLLDPLRQASERAKEVKPNLDQLKQLLDHSGLISIINLLPGPFRDQQSEAVSLIRDIAISSFNTHGDTDLSKAILTLSKKFSFKSAALKQQLEGDFKQIEKLIAEERQHEVKLTQGMEKLEVTKDGVRQGSKFISANSVSSIRWGTLITGTQYSQIHQYLLVCRDDYGNETTFSWKSTSDIKQGQEHFSSLINAAINYIVPSIVEKLLSKINIGQKASIGPCTLEKSGLSFDKSGWFNSKTVNIPWARVETDMVNGMLIVSDRASPKMRVEMSIRDTENAVLLHYFQGIFK